MKKTFTIPTGPSHIELKVDFEAPGLRPKTAERKMRELGNPIFDVSGKTITAVHQVEKVNYDHSEAAEGELVWACEHCGAYSKTKAVVEAHEAICEVRCGKSSS